ncbi:hypothetical protein CC78DRAFT_586203 [Lojkania enalia]|uniref:Uncharacterized protein n=1 Tax=Lojkania enalia TaxID=147567 RepID=A0A9P4JZA2_9PLEO|nr:hypothetical protein CC78DRAFT_586203 [Didymosphaeria enalia]
MLPRPSTQTVNDCVLEDAGLLEYLIEMKILATNMNDNDADETYDKESKATIIFDLLPFCPNTVRALPEATRGSDSTIGKSHPTSCVNECGAHDNLGRLNRGTPATKIGVLRDLEYITMERSKLIQQLNDLNTKENSLLSTLLRMEKVSPSLPHPALRSENSRPRSIRSRQSFTGETIPKDTFREKYDELSRTHSVSRPASAPTESRVTSLRSTPSTFKGTLLGNKTNEYLATSDSVHPMPTSI